MKVFLAGQQPGRDVCLIIIILISISGWDSAPSRLSIMIFETMPGVLENPQHVPCHAGGDREWSPPLDGSGSAESMRVEQMCGLHTAFCALRPIPQRLRCRQRPGAGGSENGLTEGRSCGRCDKTAEFVR